MIFGLEIQKKETGILYWNDPFISYNRHTVLTNAAVLSSVAIDTITSVIIHGVDTSCSILAGLINTIVDVCEN